MNSQAIRKIIADRDVQHCPYCARPFTHIDPPTVDHVIPLRLGGPRKQPWNLLWAHESCNQHKGCRDVLDFLREIDLSQETFIRRVGHQSGKRLSTRLDDELRVQALLARLKRAPAERKR